MFTFDIAANKSRLPLAKNAARKLRTLRHPGVVKVLDTIEVGVEMLQAGYNFVCGVWQSAKTGIDGCQYLHHYGTGCAIVMACQAEESERRDGQVGVIYSCGECEWIIWVLLRHN